MNIENLKNTPAWEWPPGADKTILKILKNTDTPAEDRELASEFAGDPAIVNLSLIDALIQIINTKDETEDLRSACTMALGPLLELLDMGDLDDHQELRTAATKIPELLQRLHSDIDEPTILRRRALETSVRYEQDWHTEAITTALNTNQPQWQRTAVFAMRFVSGFETQILTALTSQDPDTEFQAVCAADVWQIDQAWPHVLELAQNGKTEKFLRMAALDALVSIRPKEAFNIISLLENFEDDDLLELVEELLSPES